LTKDTKKLIGDLIDNISLDLYKDEKRQIPDIITFIEDREWLGLSHHATNPIHLYPMQKIMLKAFYRGSIGNEDLQLTDIEIELIESSGLNEDDRGNFLDKYNNRELFRELILVWGRRSGKDFCVSVIALYEAMKLLECEGGDPYSMYELSSANTINILTVANAKGQATIAFSEIREKMYYSEYFKDKYLNDGITAGAIYLLTPQDKIANKKFESQGLPTKKGSIGIMVGHSNSDSLLGMGCIVLILDEVASYKTTGGSSSGDRIYAALTPTVQTYVRKTYETDEEGEFRLNEHGQKIIKDRIYDGKVISISTPRAEEGKFYDLFNTAKNIPSRLCQRLATWSVNPTHTRESLRSDNNTMSEAEFEMEFGAEFSGSGFEGMFSETQVKSCCRGNNLKNITIGSPGHVYFVHLDPATSSHNYALAVVHKEFYLNKETGKAEFMVIVDHLKHWSPINGAINQNEVIQYVIGLKRKFHIGLITYDAFTSQESIIKMRKAGIPNKETKFLASFKFSIYKELENLINTNRIFIPYNHLLYNEMVDLQRRFTPTGFKIMPKKDGDGVKSDDLIDCVAGAAYQAIERPLTRLPQARVASLGNPGGDQIQWRNMQGGVYGVGTGGQVSRALENKSRLMDNIINKGKR